MPDESKQQQETLTVDEVATKERIKKEADKKTQKTVDAIDVQSVRIPSAEKSYDQYVDAARAENMAALTERENYLKTLAIKNYHIFPINTADINDPYAEPKYTETVRLEMRDVSIHQWEYFQKLKADAEDMMRLSGIPLITYQQTKAVPPSNFNKLRKDRMLKELEQYRYGFLVFFRGTSDQFNKGNYTFIRDRVDAAEYRINNSLPFSPSSSTNSSTSNTPMSDSIT